MEIESLDVKPRVSVRWPYRILAALIVLAGAVAIVGPGILSRSQEPSLPKWQLLAHLPGIAWLVRLAWYAATRGRVPAPHYWPFASERVFLFYMVICVIVSNA